MVKTGPDQYVIVYVSSVDDQRFYTDSGLPLPSAKCAKKFHLARLFVIWRKRLAHTFFADIFIFFFVISGMNCASG